MVKLSPLSNVSCDATITGLENWYPTLREEHRSSVLQNGILRKTEETGEKCIIRSTTISAPHQVLYNSGN
jgi:hypothetical protein